MTKSVETRTDGPDGLGEMRERLRQVADPVALLEGLFAYAPVGFQIYRSDGHCLLTNQAFRDLFGSEPPPEYNVLEDEVAARAGVRELTRRAFAGETITTPPFWYDPREQPEPIRPSTGRRCAVSVTTFPLRAADGRIGHVALVFKDVTAELLAREEAEAERDRLRQNQATLQAFLDHAPAIVFLKDLEGRHLLISREGERALGFGPDAIGKTAQQLFGAEYAARSAAAEREVIARRAPVQQLHTIPSLNGMRPYLVTRFPLLGPDGELVGIGGIAVDVNERERVAEELRKSEGRFSRVFQSLPMAALISRVSDKRFIDVNDAWARVTGYSRDELIGKTSVELGLWQDVSQREVLFRQIAEQGAVRDFAATLHQKSGALREVLLSVDQIEIGGEQCLLLLLHDVTDFRQLEHELRHAQKMEAVGRLAGGVAHDFNNILTAIRGASSLLLEGLPAGDARRRFAEQIERSTVRATALTRQLLTFTRKQPFQPLVLDPNAAVRASVEMLQRMIGEDIAVRTELSSTGGVKADVASLEQVVLNLAVNARDAMPNGGTLTLRTRDVNDEWVMIAVEDTGIGMDAETRAHLFEPFFTTKEPGKGTGLGLSTAYGIIKQAGGYIRVFSEPGQGARFEVYLPRHNEPGQVAAPVPREPAPGGHETVLLVEDDDAVRDFARFVLMKLGYRVLEASDGPQAIKLAEEFREPIDLLVCDVVMPHMNGVEVARRLTAARPGMKVLHVSGYPGHAERGSALSRFLPKPFDQGGLARAVRNALDGT
jgi:PAS domain S-box-containing protein